MKGNDISDNVTTALSRLEAVRGVLEALKDLSPEDARWVLRRAQDTLSPVVTPPPADPTLRENGSTRVPDENVALGDFVASVQPETEYDRVLAVGFYLQSVLDQPDFDSYTITTQLKDLGYQVTNITRVFDDLMKRNPTMAIQTKKTGTSRQARKRYRLTQHGLRYVQSRANAT
jgi:hypothetical protein